MLGSMRRSGTGNSLGMYTRRLPGRSFASFGNGPSIHAQTSTDYMHAHSEPVLGGASVKRKHENKSKIVNKRRKANVNKVQTSKSNKARKVQKAPAPKSIIKPNKPVVKSVGQTSRKGKQSVGRVKRYTQMPSII